MLISASTAMTVAFLPNHESPFLFAVGIFSLYFILTGKRALKYKDRNTHLLTDKWISRIMIISGVLMIFLPIIRYQKINMVLSVFAIIGVAFAVKDLVLYKNPIKLEEQWLKMHLGKMIGAYISSVTTFVVVNDFFPSPYGWFIPGLIGGFFIRYWINEMNKRKISIDQ